LEAAQDRDAVMVVLRGVGIAAGVAQTREDRCDADPDADHLQWPTELPNPGVGTWLIAELPFDLSEAPLHNEGCADRGVPVYREHNDEV
jgi:hypothetical protein